MLCTLLRQGERARRRCIIPMGHHAARTGFKNLTMPFLKKLHGKLKVPWTCGQKLSTEVPPVAALVKHVLGDTCAKQQLEKAVAGGGKVNSSSALLGAARAFRMGKWKPDIDEGDDEESLTDNDEDVQKQFEKLKECHTAPKAREQARLEKLEPLLGAGSVKPAKPSRSLVPVLMTWYLGSIS